MAQTKSKPKSRSSKNKSPSKFKKLVIGRSRRFYFVGILFVLAFAAFGTWQLGNSNAGTSALSTMECHLRGREYADRENYCTSNCSPGAGPWIKNVDQYGFCDNAISQTIGQSKCDSLGRKFVGAIGCARRWQQTTITGAIQCQSGSVTYHVASPYDYCGSSSGGGWVWPLPASHRVATGWGVSTSKGLHKGIDIGDHGGNLYAHVVAAHAGTVTQSYNSGACGYFLVIKAADTPYWQGYQHLEVGSAQVKVGEYVHAGEYIARVGTAGGSTCGTAGFYHLHFSVEKGNWISFYSSPLSHSINPLSVLPH